MLFNKSIIGHFLITSNDQRDDDILEICEKRSTGKNSAIQL